MKHSDESTNPVLRTAKDMKMLKRLKRLLKTYHKWSGSRWAWLRARAVKAALEGQEVERYLARRTQEAMLAQHVLVFGSSSEPFSITEKFLHATSTKPGTRSVVAGLHSIVDRASRAVDQETRRNSA